MQPRAQALRHSRTQASYVITACHGPRALKQDQFPVRIYYAEKEKQLSEDHLAWNSGIRGGCELEGAPSEATVVLQMKKQAIKHIPSEATVV